MHAVYIKKPPWYRVASFGEGDQRGNKCDRDFKSPSLPKIEDGDQEVSRR